MTPTRRPIVQLSESVSNQIAAGEVVERPASVVKELVENAIDAQATRIAVDIRGGGLESIQVTDNGVGMPASEVSLAFARHATSKIRTAEDLFAISSLGFRGEALPSIASVSHVTLRTKTREADQGTEIRLEGGRRVALEPVGTPDGTTVIVSRLFYNTPARRKFLKSESSERRAVAELLTKMALAHPDIQFIFTAEGKEMLRTPGDGDLQAAAGAVYGYKLARMLIPIKKEAHFGQVTGLVAPPTEAKGTRQHISIFVNGRWVDSSALTIAVERGYANLLPVRRFPVAIVQIQIDPTLVDVNVHPAKTEVRFRDEREIFSATLHAVREGLLAVNLIPSVSGQGRPLPSESSHQVVTQTFSFYPRPSKRRPEEEKPSIVWHAAAEPAATGPSETAATSAYEVVDYATGEVREVSPRQRTEHWRDALRSVPVEQAVPMGPANADEARAALREAKVVGQVLATYMIVPVPWGLWLIDQHVAHERILFEEALASARRPADSQRLLVPLQVDLSPAAIAALGDLAPALQEMGFELEEFGGTSVLARAVPAELANRTDVIPELLEELTDVHAERRTEERRERLAAMVACKGAVKAGQHLTADVMQSLLTRLADTENPFACPHGRPIIVEIGQAELERRFGRR